MYKLIKKTIKKIFHFFNIDIKFFTPYSDEQQLVKTLLMYKNIDLVLDVGANTGQYASSIRNLGYKGRIISFEPTASAHKVLKANKLNIEVYDKCAIGQIDGNIEINISRNSVSSSILEIKSEHTAAEPTSEYISREKVQILKLDSIIDKNLSWLKSNIYLKIDTQGFEFNVLLGLEKYLRNISVLQIEISLVELYEGQPNWKKILEYMEINNFEIWTIIPGFCDPKTGKLLQVDFIFSNKFNENNI